MKPKVITEQEYLEAVESNQGFCTACQEFTNDFAEPDARGYKCDVCEKKTVYGAEEALLMGLVTL
jgi:methionyl-tRNA synthetase